MDASLEAGRIGQFEVLAGDETIATRGGNWITRRLGAGYPDLEEVVSLLETRLAREARRP